MKDVRLTSRMKQVADMVPWGIRVADIGCDHAYVAMYLCQVRQCSRVIAMDVRKGPLDIARSNVHRAGLEDRIELRLSDGLAGLEPGEVDALVIAGMGGPLMIRILEGRRSLLAGVTHLILQPQSEISAVRRYVRQSGYEITREAMVWDKEKPYFVMSCETAKGQKTTGDPQAAQDDMEPWSDVEYEYGKRLLEQRDEGLYTFLKQEADKLMTIRSRLREQGGEGARERIRTLEKQLAQNQAGLSYYR